jgi:hypothetical protein
VASARLQRQWQRFAGPGLQCARGHPAQLFAPDQLAVAGAAVTPADHQVEFAGFLQGPQVARDASGHLQVQRRVAGLESQHDAGHQLGREVLGDAQPQPAQKRGLGQRTHAFVVQAQHLVGVSQQLFAARCERHCTFAAFKERKAQALLQVLDLHAHRRLGAADTLGRTCEVALLGHGGKAAQGVDIQVHAQSSGNQITVILIIRWRRIQSAPTLALQSQLGALR